MIGVAINRDKGPLFSLEERVAMIKAECAPLAEQTGTEIVVHPFENLLIDCARDVGAQIIIRGLRAVADFEYEFQMVGMNRTLDDSIETVFLMADAKHQAIAQTGEGNRTARRRRQQVRDPCRQHRVEETVCQIAAHADLRSRKVGGTGLGVGPPPSAP